METMCPSKRTCFRNSFFTAADNISEGLSTGISVVDNGHWIKWDMFCRDVYLETLLVLYRYLAPIINAFVRNYRTGSIDPSGHQVISRTVEDAIRSIGEVLADLDTRDPRLTSQGQMDICLRFQYRCYSKQDPPPSRLNPTPLQVLRHISIISNALGDPIL